MKHEYVKNEQAAYLKSCLFNFEDKVKSEEQIR